MDLKLATYNIHFGSQLDLIEKNLKKLRALGADCICLQEVCELKGQPPLVKAVQKSLGPDWKLETFIKPGTHDLGLCVCWKPKIMKHRKTERLLLPRLKRFNFYENFVERKLVRLVTKPVQRGALIMKFKVNGENLRLTNLHLDPHGHLSHRLKQITYLAGQLNSSPRQDHEIICGDFNTIGAALLFHHQEKKLLSALPGGFISADIGHEETEELLQRLDYVFVKNAVIRKAQRLNLKGSDHFPLMVTLELTGLNKPKPPSGLAKKI